MKDDEDDPSRQRGDENENDPLVVALKAAWSPTEIDPEEHARIVTAEVGVDPLVDALKAAWSPAELSADEHAKMIADLPTEEELKLAPLVDEDEMVLALKAAWNPSPLTDAEHRAMVDRATARMVIQPRSPSRVRVVVGTSLTILALAAAVVLFVRGQDAEAPMALAPLAHARSTQPLFSEPFKEGETSARIDRIAIARASDYRDNYFAKRGVK